jgi:hypothetical protein
MIFHIDAALFTSTPANLIQHQRTSEVPLHHHLEMFVHQCGSPPYHLEMFVHQCAPLSTEHNPTIHCPSIKLPQIHKKSNAYIGASNGNHQPSPNLKILEGCMYVFYLLSALASKQGHASWRHCNKIQQKDAPSTENHNSHKKTFNTQTVYKRAAAHHLLQMSIATTPT